MTIQEFIDELREDYLDDRVKPYYWSDDTLVRYANRAEEEACRRANLIIDDTTPSVCILNITAGTHTYQLHPKVLLVLAAYDVTNNQPIFQTDRVALDSMRKDWEIWESKSPQFFMLPNNNSIRFIPKPSEDAQVRLTVSRLPLTVKGISDSFEIPERYHKGLLFYAAYLALLKQDTNTERGNKSQEYLAQFTAMFGKPRDALSESNARRFSRTSSMRAIARTLGFP